MTHDDFLAQALVLLGAIVVIVPLVQRLGLGSVPGYLVAGVLIGPPALGLVSEVELIGSVAELGVVFLLFSIGIELRPARLWLMRRLAFGLGTLQVLASGAAIGLGAALLGCGAKAAAVAGLGLALSSTALVIQTLAERRELATPSGRAALAVLLLQDLAVAPLVTLVYVLAGGALALHGQTGLALLQALGVLAAFLLLGRWGLRHLLPIAAAMRNPDILVAVALLLVLGAAWLVEAAGFSLALGAFLAGVLLAESPFRHQVIADIHPFRGVLLGLFFMSVGMSIDLGFARQLGFWLPALALGVMAFKAALLIALGRLFGLATPDALRLGLQLSQAGEFALVLFALAAEVGVLDAATKQVLLQIVVLSMLLAAPAFALGTRLAARLEERAARAPAIPDPGDPPHGHVIICGFGRVGRQVANLLDAAGVGWLATDVRAETVELARLARLPVYFGDAGRPEILRALRVEQAGLVLVTLDDVGAAERAVQAARRLAPRCELIVRAVDSARARELRHFGASRAVPETTEYSLQLGLAGLAALGLEPARLQELETGFRAEDYRHLLVDRVGGPEAA